MTIMALFSCVIVFHLLVLSGVLPYNIVWGGRLENATQMHVFEAVSLMINLVVIVVVGIKGGYIKPFLPAKLVNFLLWVFAILLALNTLGNLFAETMLEMVLFTPLTFISTVLFYRMAIEK